jgi:cell division protein FtsB
VASGPRPPARPGGGPGRGKPRARATPRERSTPDPATEPTVALEATGPGSTPPRTPAGAPGRAPAKATKGVTATGGGTVRGGSTAAPAAKAAGKGKARRRRASAVLHRAVRANLTARALALVVVVLVLTISYATSLRIYFAQAHDIASTKAEIVQSQAAITDLQAQIARWNDPAYVAAQARERLGWLVPGETGYTVVGPDGKPLGGGLTLDSSATSAPEQQQMWWDRMWGSVAAADKPAPVKANPAKRPPVTPDSKPR